MRVDYFTKNIKELGPNFPSIKPQKALAKDAVIIFREIARGSIDLKQYGNYFTDVQFVNILLDTANAKYQEHYLLYYGLTLVMNSGTNDISVATLQDKYKRIYEAYNIIVNTLQQVLYTGDISYIYALPNYLQNYKYSIQ